MNAVILTRKDKVLEAETFIFSAYLGLTAVKSDRKRLSTVAGSLSFLTQDLVDGDFDCRPHPSRQDFSHAEEWVLAQPRLQLSVREGRLLYLRGYVRMPWKVLAERFSMSWDEARREFDNSAVVVYDEVLVRLRSASAA
jgi:hypothetical protein